MFSDHKKLRNEEKYFIKITKPYLLYFLKIKPYDFYCIIVKQTDKIFKYDRNVHRKKTVLYLN